MALKSLLRVLAALCMTFSASASQSFHFDHEGFLVDATVPWSADRYSGYLPVLFQVTNSRGGEGTLTLELRQLGGRNQPTSLVRQTLRLESGQRARLEFDLLTLPGGVRSSMLQLITREGRSGHRISVERKLNHTNQYTVASFTPDPSPAGTDERLARALATGEIEMSGGAGGSRMVPNVAMNLCRFEELPSRAQAFTSLDLVILDASERVPAAAELEPLLAWVRLGGRLLVTGEGSVVEIARKVGLEEACEDRFRWPSSEPREGASFSHVGLGRAAFVPLAMDAGDDPDFRLAAERLRDSNDHAVLRVGSEPPPGPIPGLEELPLRGFMLILILFVITIGPLNLLWVKYKKKPALLLVSVPLLSVVTSVGIVSYGMLSQGLGVKGYSESWTVLDQRTKQASSIEWRTFYAGLSPGSGLRPGPGTSVHPAYIEQRSDIFSVDHDKGRLLGGMYQPVRQPASQVVLTDTDARGRLTLGEDRRVSNGFEEDLLGLLFCDPNGDYYVHRGRISPGETVELESSDAGRAESILSVLGEVPLHAAGSVLGGGSSLLNPSRPLVPGTYVARFAKNPFTDNAGLEFDREDGPRFVYGILPLNGTAGGGPR